MSVSALLPVMNSGQRDGGSESDRQRRRILIADDDPGTLSTLTLLLRDAGYSVTAAQCRPECISALRQEQFDIFLVDWRFGGSDGISLTRRLRGIGLVVPVVLMSGFATMNAVVAAMRVGINDFIEKPLDATNLLTVLDRTIRVARTSPRVKNTANRGHGIVRQVATLLSEELHQPINVASSSEYVSKRQRMSTLVARACAESEANISEFVICATVLRRLSSASAGLLRHALIEARDALETDAWPIATGSTPCTQRLIDALTSADGLALARSETEWGVVLGIHRSHVGRVLYSQTGRRFREWRRVCRMKRAAYLLFSGDEQAAQIAYQVGFKHTQLSQFAREFHQTLGLTPLAFRQIARTRMPSNARMLMATSSPFPSHP